MNPTDDHQQDAPIGFLLIFSEIISNDQIQKAIEILKQSLKRIDADQFRRIEDLLNSFIDEKRFEPENEFRQIENLDDGSIVGFLYRTNFHAVSNVIEEFFNACSTVSLIFCGQQVFPSGDLVLADSTLRPQHFSRLFSKNKMFRIENLQVVLPFVTNNWKQIEKLVKNFTLSVPSTETKKENMFGEIFYEKLVRRLTEKNISFEVHEKLVPRQSSGSIAFEDPTLYVFYGQQGECSLFGIRGFVVLVNSGFSRVPSFWNLIRGLETIDACILTHFDFDVLSGLQTVLRRKLIPNSTDGTLCKPDLSTIFLNQNQQKKLSAQPKPSDSPLLVSLHENVQQLLGDLKDLKIGPHDLVKNCSTNRKTIEPINLFKKISCGSLDLYVLHPTGTPNENDKILMDLEKIKIGRKSNNQSIPLDHWYSSCSLLVWTDASKSNKERPIRILYTGVCPQTLIFHSLENVSHLDFLSQSESNEKERAKRVSSPASRSTSAKPTSRQPTSVEKPKTTENKRNLSTSQKLETQKKAINPEKVRVTAPLEKVKPTTAGRNPSQQRTTTSIEKVPVTQRSPSVEKKQNKTNPVKTSKTKQLTKAPSVIESPRKIDRNGSTNIDNKKGTSNVEKIPAQQSKNLIEENHQEKELNPTAELDIAKENLHEKEAVPIERIDGQEKDLSEAVSAPTVESKSQEETHQENEIGSTAELDSCEENHQGNEPGSTIEPESQEENFQETESVPKVEPESQEENHQGNEPDLTLNPEIQEENHDGNQSGSTTEPDVLVENVEDNQCVQTEENNDPAENLQNEAEGEAISIDDEKQFEPIESSPEVEKIEFIDASKEKSEHEEPFEIVTRQISSSKEENSIEQEKIEPLGLPVKKSVSSASVDREKLSNTQTRKFSASSTNDSLFFVDVAFIPHHGDENYVDSEFFRRIRARYYVLNGVDIDPSVFDSIVEGKKSWSNNEQITIVPTFDGETLRQFFVTNKNLLAELNIQILTASTRCQVQYDDQGSPAQRILFHRNENAL